MTEKPPQLQGTTSNLFPDPLWSVSDRDPASRTESEVLALRKMSDQSGPDLQSSAGVTNQRGDDQH